jgi:FkbM family methyltransferase
VFEEVGGVRMRLAPFRNVAEKRLLFAPATFDARERALVASRLGPGAVFLDIGANVGGWSLYAARCGARVLAVEPQASVLAKLEVNLALNPDLNVRVAPIALAGHVGVVRLTMPANNEGEASIAGGVEGDVVEIACDTLENLLAREGVQSVDAMKIDVEGAEDIVLGPFFDSAPRRLWPHILVMEHLSGRWRRDIAREVQALGYREIGRTHQNVVLERAGAALKSLT